MKVSPQRCDDPAPHDEHIWDDGKDSWHCEGRRAHTNVMIGRNG